MTLQLVSRIAPQEYVSEVKAYDRLADALKARFIKRVLFLHGTKSMMKAAPFLPDLKEQGIDVVDVLFNGECSTKEIQRMIDLLKSEKLDAIIGLGGGKVLDTAKAAGYKAGTVPVILLPTMASNCAAWSNLSVLYKDNGECIGHQIYPQQTSLVLIDPRVILDSPINYFIAGVADTIAKWYESDLLLQQANRKSLALYFAREAARQCLEIPLHSAEKAIQDMRNGQLTDDWTQVMETNVMASGLVAGFGDEYGRATAAHAIHDALTIRPETHHLLHGIKVSYGIMVELIIEGKEDEMKRLLPFYRALHLPLCLADLSLSGISDGEIREIAEVATRPNSLIQMHPMNCTVDTVYDAIIGLEEWAKQNTVR
ncbi:iron-containing alcohol dehydrogenase family protein [Sporolactobacillus kofuensis]|uniref:Iron-containing alcohol dehydrogenase family protein n=1 Tax=Sporolactobacillus kofuensis TaxID=269672 RepID=A0ABW1WFC2_9BACL|nr:iron-containing alcohol dehydrogenase family protein [Sporolactobacillus kofuensis]MCO7176567.1 iron-containing alcohol dehydrogenase family protein [Sporolactobacillus kofuensis]